MNLTIEFEQEEDDRWLAEITDLPGVMVYGQTREEAMARVHALALRVDQRPIGARLSGGKCLACLSSQHELIAVHESPPSVGRPAAHRLEGSSANRDRTLSRPGWPDVVFAFHDNEEIGPRMLARIARWTRLSPEERSPLLE